MADNASLRPLKLAFKISLCDVNPECNSEVKIFSHRVTVPEFWTACAIELNRPFGAIDTVQLVGTLIQRSQQ